MDKFNEVENIISQLNTMDKGMGVDGEVMQYILQQVGMEYQMLKQLMMTMPLEQVEHMMKERKELEKSFWVFESC